MPRALKSGGGPPDVTTTAPLDTWVALFLRDLWHLDVAPDVPVCDPAPMFGPIKRGPTDQERTMVDYALTLCDVSDSQHGEAAGGDLAALIEHTSQQDAWRAWRSAGKLALQDVSASLDRSPSWLARDALAARKPPVTRVVVVPVAGAFSRACGGTLYVALKTYVDVAAFREVIRSTPPFNDAPRRG